jgi:hypothetical protein
MINLDTVPDKNPTAPLAEGTYLATVTKTEMKQPNDLAKPMYLQVSFKMEGTDGETGSFTDRFFESDSSYVLFKLTRFLKANAINLSGNVELSDIEKLITVGDQVVTVIRHSKNEYQGNETIQAEVDLFNSDCYYPASDWAKFKGEADDPFNQAQASDEADIDTSKY